MSEEILINVTPQETRVAVVEHGVLQEVHIERMRSLGLVGNIYKGKVVRVLPGMQAAFVDIGLERAAFLHAADAQGGIGAADAGVARAASNDISYSEMAADEPPEKANDAQSLSPRIHELLHDGEERLVQVVKDPIGTKGARLTTQIALPGRYVVYMPYTRHIGISQKIVDDAARDRLRELMNSLMSERHEGGYILRTLAETASEEELSNDIHYLSRVWAASLESIRSASPGTLIHEDVSLALRAMRDLAHDNVEKIRIDSRETYTKACAFAHNFIPEIEDRIEYYPGERPIFDLYSVEEEIKKALEPKVMLKSRGYLVIEQTEAMTTVDVNTGTFVGHRNLEETLFRTNLEAAQAVARQLRLRNLGGMIIVDFIDMADTEHRRQVLRALERALARDRTKVYITEMSSLGLVELTRKRTRESLEHVLCQPCPVCQGRGTMKTPQTVCYEIVREILRQARQFEVTEFLVIASPTVIDLLVDEDASGLIKLQEHIGKTVHLKVETGYYQEQFDVVLT